MYSLLSTLNYKFVCIGCTESHWLSLDNQLSLDNKYITGYVLLLCGSTTADASLAGIFTFLI